MNGMSPEYLQGNKLYAQRGRGCKGGVAGIIMEGGEAYRGENNVPVKGSLAIAEVITFGLFSFHFAT